MAAMLKESAWTDISIPKKQPYVNANHILERGKKKGEKNQPWILPKTDKC